MTAPIPPAQAKSFSVHRLRGRHEFLLTHTVGPDRGQTIRGVLTITNDSAGSVIISSAWPRYLSFAPAESGAGRRSVDVLFGADRRLKLVLGNPHLQWTDAGVFLDVFTATDSLIVGRWVDGGIAAIQGSPEGHPQGWFCLTRSGR